MDEMADGQDTVVLVPARTEATFPFVYCHCHVPAPLVLQSRIESSRWKRTSPSCSPCFSVIDHLLFLRSPFHLVFGGKAIPA